ncbi:hypothetical protein [Corynebacterium freiburgense]|uniref:hypothetical protein n=1 Tax=Corynebacterium freiburgense TaxID=556548 RepID=UPI0004788F34|nr:hypothetical protein [Corynebacterium freiburgense]WJZ01859.1 hypothetical protein CFREI_02775 [Corynebacterium freiburgense]
MNLLPKVILTAVGFPSGLVAFPEFLGGSADLRRVLAGFLGAGWAFPGVGWFPEPSGRFPCGLIGSPYQTGDVFISTVADSIKSAEKMEFVTATNLAHNR